MRVDLANSKSEICIGHNATSKLSVTPSCGLSDNTHSVVTEIITKPSPDDDEQLQCMHQT